jgi:putative ABC transport system ATP-binding protein
MSPIIEIRNLQKTYFTEGVATQAIRGISLSIEAGEFLAIMGPSGSGKSTLLQLLGLLDEPTSGEYFLNGKNIKDYSKKEIAHLRNQMFGFIFQNFNLLLKATVLENVKLPLLYSDVPEKNWDEMARKAIEAAGLSVNRLNFEAGRLSGGEQQRVAIARALVNNPMVIFADEPTGNLDSKTGQVVMETIQRLHQEQGRTIVLVTHETYTAEYAETIIKLRDGLIESRFKVINRHFAQDGFKK